MAIKLSIGKLAVTAPLDVLIPQQLSLNGIESLNISTDHAAAVVTLPFHHRDPFDRMLIAQAVVEKMSVVGIDTAFDTYSVMRLW